MKRYTVILLTCLFCFTLLPYDSSAIKLHFYGKAGVQYQNGKIKICPGIDIKKCATLKLNWKEFIDYIFGSAQAPAGIVEVLDDDGEVEYTISVTVVGINNNVISENSPPEHIRGDDIELE